MRATLVILRHRHLLEITLITHRSQFTSIKEIGIYVGSSGRLINPKMVFGSFNTVRRRNRGYEVINMMPKDRVKSVKQEFVRKQVEFLHQIQYCFEKG